MHTLIPILTVVCFIAFAPNALAQEAPDLTQIVGFVRWGGVLLSGFVLVGAMVMLRLLGVQFLFSFAMVVSCKERRFSGDWRWHRIHCSHTISFCWEPLPLTAVVA